MTNRARRHEDDRTADEVEADLAFSRRRLSASLEALQGQLAGAGGYQDVAASLIDELEGAARALGRRVRDNPGPALAIGAGLAMLALNARRETPAPPAARAASAVRESADDAADRVTDLGRKARERVEESADTLAGGARDAGERVADAAGRGADAALRFSERNPALTGAMAAALGAVAAGALSNRGGRR